MNKAGDCIEKSVALTPPQFTFFRAIPEDVTRYITLRMLPFNDLARVAQTAFIFNKLVDDSSRVMVYIKQGRKLLAQALVVNTLPPLLLAAVHIPDGWLALGEGLVRVDELMTLPHFKWQKVLTPLGLYALRNRTLNLTQIARYDTSLLVLLFATSEKFHLLVPNHQALLVLLKQYPLNAGEIIERLLANKAEFQQLFTHIYHVVDSVTLVPLMSEHLLNFVLNDEKEFERLFPTIFSVIDAVIMLPYLMSRLMENVLRHESGFMRLINAHYDLCQLTDTCKPYHNAIIYFVLNHDNVFAKLIDNHYAFVAIARYFNHYADEITDRILQSDHVHHYILDNDDLLNAAEQLPSQATKIMAWLLANDADDFQRLVVNSYHFVETVNAFPSAAALLFVESICADRWEFSRLMETSEDIENCINKLPQYRQILIDTWLENAGNKAHTARHY